MPRVILDSDDEGDSLSITSEPAPDESKAPLPASKNDESSAEILRREAEMAQASLFNAGRKRASSISADASTTPKPSMQPPAKRQKTANKSSTAASPRTQSARKKSVKAYGQSATRSAGISSSDSSFEAMKDEEPPRKRGLLGDAVDEGLPTGLQDDEAPKSWHLPASLQNDFARHDPVSMFPDASSTNPDNTLTQQRMIQEALAENAANRQMKDGDAKGSNSSVPWSAYMALPSDHNQSDAEGNLLPLNAQSQASLGDALEPKKASEFSPIRSSDASSSVAAVIAASTASSRNKSGQMDGAVLSSLRKATEPAKSTPVPSKQSAKTSDYDRASAVADDVDELGGDQKQSEEPRNHGSSRSRSHRSKTPSLEKDNREKTSSTSTRKRQADGNCPDSDELAIGLPKEQYKPRPSRSRSAQVSNEPIDYSIAPEKAVRSKIKRAKTTNSSIPSVQSPPAVELDLMKDMGFSPGTSRKALAASNGDVAAAVNGLLQQTVSKNSRAKETAVEEKSFSKLNQSAASSEKPHSESKVVVEIPYMKTDPLEYERISQDFNSTLESQPKSPSQHAQENAVDEHHVSADISKSEVQESDVDDSGMNPPKMAILGAGPAKKRGRGRPGKAAPKPSAIEDSEAEDDDELYGELNESISHKNAATEKRSRRRSSRSTQKPIIETSIQYSKEGEKEEHEEEDHAIESSPAEHQVPLLPRRGRGRPAKPTQKIKLHEPIPVSELDEKILTEEDELHLLAHSDEPDPDPELEPASEPHHEPEFEVELEAELEAEAEPEPEVAPAPAPAPTPKKKQPPKKRGRGRPAKSVATIAVHEDEEQVDPSHHEELTAKSLVGDEANILQTGSKENQPAPPSTQTPPPSPHTAAAAAKDVSDPPHDSTADASMHVETPVSTDAERGRGSMTPTPGPTASSGVAKGSFAKGKVPYRVGLSRTSRIPSLLRVVKK
ncbi:hypothetical protein K402DRAFT_456945 [Aulographum hederae CBS 113979]|uniref:UBA domain-containing protein n=1 Tax=Aulographum hederae CBS 113979 TaxID=1176131 RepID=A0A6G1GQ32_9PEZI|nr:hypothetical protein K402DRAFT_456945 [Aulographum hederae CBS 113979]